MKQLASVRINRAFELWPSRSVRVIVFVFFDSCDDASAMAAFRYGSTSLSFVNESETWVKVLRWIYGSFVKF